MDTIQDDIPIEIVAEVSAPFVIWIDLDCTELLTLSATSRAS